MPVTLAEHWRMDAEDIRQFRPRNVWWYGSGTVSEGANTALSDLAMEGYQTGRQARLAMLDIIGRL
jgi:hypothetical protein